MLLDEVDVGEFRVYAAAVDNPNLQALTARPALPEPLKSPRSRRRPCGPNAVPLNQS
jgi:hypothetical protein